MFCVNGKQSVKGPDTPSELCNAGPRVTCPGLVPGFETSLWDLTQFPLHCTLPLKSPAASPPQVLYVARNLSARIRAFLCAKRTVHAPRAYQRPALIHRPQILKGENFAFLGDKRVCEEGLRKERQKSLTHTFHSHPVHCG